MVTVAILFENDSVAYCTREWLLHNILQSKRNNERWRALGAPAGQHARGIMARRAARPPHVS